ncbi:uncharacterized protein LOC125768305 [Anopheles funestus]|uniref:uncharacterized protein LOC125768305 n=1 Tax=Anopheles funestus TaxID=62324 RepID=UPI0020C73423|nr:uncharacterized protein LOC125768305 [Anopheles funestus]
MEPNCNQEDLLNHIRFLTNSHNDLLEEMKRLKAKADDPYLSYRTPDPVRNLPNFDGNKSETQAWIEDTETALALFKNREGSPMYDQLVRAVKCKITGQAREAVIAAGNVNTWPEIKDVLTNAFGDKRDLTSHIQQLFYERQGKKSLAEYYNSLKKLETKIRSITASADEYKNSTTAVHHLIGVITLTRFIDGLEGTLSSYVRSCKPNDLDEAYSVSIEYTNASYRRKLEQTNTEERGRKKYDNETPSTSYSNRKNTQSDKPWSDKFRNKSFQEKKTNDDVSMRTLKSRMQINNAETDDKTVDNESDELNFHMVLGERSDT